jgi:hypothetical protein
MPDPRHRGPSREQGDLSTGEGREDSSRWEGRNRGADAGVSLLGGGREGERDAGGWGAMAEQWDSSSTFSYHSVYAMKWFGTLYLAC